MIMTIPDAPIPPNGRKAPVRCAQDRMFPVRPGMCLAHDVLRVTRAATEIVERQRRGALTWSPTSSGGDGNYRQDGPEISSFATRIASVVLSRMIGGIRRVCGRPRRRTLQHVAPQRDNVVDVIASRECAH
jgi:hypothetical protein